MSPERFVHYITGFHQMDAEHLQLFTTLDNLIVCLKEADKLAAEKLVTELKLMMYRHCKTERELMVAHDYPYIEYHCEQHGQIIKNLNTLAASLHKSPYFSHNFITDFEEKFLSHLDHEDMKFANWVKENGKL
jgi:hemerythrin-like metal-binding protein